MPYYIKAYPLERLREFPGWKPRISTENAVPDDDVLYLHQDFVVTRNTLPDPNRDVVFDDVSEEWMAFCRRELGFTIPDWAQDSSSK